MALNRRGFIGALAAAMTLDPERALWIPGAKTISIPKPITAVDWEALGGPLMNAFPVVGSMCLAELLNQFAEQINYTWKVYPDSTGYKLAFEAVQ